MEETIKILGATLLSGVLLVGLVNLVDFWLDWWICGLSGILVALPVEFWLGCWTCGGYGGHSAGPTDMLVVWWT